MSLKINKINSICEFNAGSSLVTVTTGSEARAFGVAPPVVDVQSSPARAVSGSFSEKHDLPAVA